MGDEWEYFPEIKWVDSFWGETEDLENPVLIEKRSLDAVIQKTDELLERAVQGNEDAFEDEIVTFMDDAFGPDVKLGSDKYRRDLVEWESEIVDLFASAAPLSGIEYIPGDAVAFTKNKQVLREKFLPFGMTEIGKYLITLYDDFYMEAMIDSRGVQRIPQPGTPAMVCFNATMAMDCIIQGGTKDENIYKISYLDITSYNRESVRVHNSRIAAPFGFNLAALDQLSEADFRVWKPTMVINGTPRILNRYPLYFAETPVNTEDGKGEIVTSYDEDPEHPDKYGVRLVGNLYNQIVWYDVWEFQVENPNTAKWKEYNNKLDKLYRHSKENKSPPPSPPSSPPSVAPPKPEFVFEIGDIVQIPSRNSGEWKLMAYYQDRWFADMIGHSESGHFDDRQLVFVRRPVPVPDIIDPPVPVVPDIIDPPVPVPTDIFVEDKSVDRRRLMNEGDIRWWDDRRWVWKYGRTEYPYPVRRAVKVREKADHGGIFEIPDFVGKILLDDDEPNHALKSYEMLNVYVDELLDAVGANMQTEFEMNIGGEDDRPERLAQVDLFSKRLTDDPSFGWTIADDRGGEISNDSEHSQLGISGLGWLYEAFFFGHTTHDADEADEKTFWRILNTIAGSRVAGDWHDPYQHIEHTESYFRMLYNRASNLYLALNFHRNTGEYYFGGTEFSGLHTMKRLEAELMDCIEASGRIWGRHLEPVDYGRAPTLDMNKPYRPDFKSGGDEMYWEMFEQLPRPEARHYESIESMEAFFRDTWLPYFRDWPYADTIHVGEFLVGKSAWRSDLQNSTVELKLTDTPLSYLFMTPAGNIVTQNVELMGLTGDRVRARYSMPKDGNPELFMIGFHNVFVDSGYEHFPTISPNLRNPAIRDQQPNIRVYNMETDEEIFMNELGYVGGAKGPGAVGPKRASGGGGAIVVLAFAALIAFSYST